jgi:hypothetical protein
MIAAVKITIGFSESPHIREGIDFAGPCLWQAAADYLTFWPGPDLGYYKTDFTVTYEDGTEYSGRYDIGADRDTLGDHMRAFIHGVVDRGDWRPSKENVEYLTNFRTNYEIGA